jgi:DNA-binding NarL/FixJ family response regulator
MSGVELLERMRAAHLSAPVIMATSAVPEAEFAAKPWLQPTAILLKPYTIAQLVAAVNEVLHTTDALRDEIVRHERAAGKRSAKSAQLIERLQSGHMG